MITGDRFNRRALLRGAGLTMMGAAAGLLGASEIPHHPPLGGGYASAADTPSAIARSSVTVRYFVSTSAPVVALTFDDGPGPNWTPRFLDVLEEAGVPATFFMVGRNVRAHGGLVRDRLAGHEVGNHSWAHHDLATMDLGAVRDDLWRTHQMIQGELGRTPTLMRPPYGHLGGSTVLAADSLGYDVILWDRQMHERRFRRDPGGQAKDIADSVRPGSIVLSHDVGDPRRLIALDALPGIIAGLKERGYGFATVSDLIASAPAGSSPENRG
ncbi:polysaccharide deacetylase family protein [Actinoplanes sp. CA-030573]|uniref:polysaccharide deacetylase family protein n=1 Tax=Actinoplanes sp. CA-030573 TaxID=3239898 RepID=UPI003D911F7F